MGSQQTVKRVGKRIQDTHRDRDGAHHHTGLEVEWAGQSGRQHQQKNVGRTPAMVLVRMELQNDDGSGSALRLLRHYNARKWWIVVITTMGKWNINDTPTSSRKKKQHNIPPMWDSAAGGKKLRNFEKQYDNCTTSCDSFNDGDRATLMYISENLHSGQPFASGFNQHVWNSNP